MSKPKILFFDIETTPLQAWVWSCGKQVIRHGQLVEGPFSQYNILCITYCWNDGKPAKALVWDYESQDSSAMIEAFDAIVRKADVVIGKNSDRFDVKHINTQRLLHGQPGFPEWATATDDLEKQMRKHFYLPSYSLDYFSELLGFGGKIKMEMQDWINIVLKIPGRGKKSLKKMVEYGKKDVEDTRDIWDRCAAHFTPKYNVATKNKAHCCRNCGSTNIRKNGTRAAGTTTYQHFFCNEHGGHAGKAAIKADGTLGRMM